MYCSSCGTESTQGLNYCNRCGATLGTQTFVSPPFSVTKPTLILGGLAALISLFGFVALVAGGSELASKGFELGQVMGMLFAGMFIIFAVDVILLKQMCHIINASLRAGANRPVQQVTKIAEPVQTQRKLTAPPLEPVASVTENTTRTFDPVYRETSR